MAYSSFLDKYMFNTTLEPPRAGQFYAFNSATQKSEPCDKTRPNAEKSVGVRMEKAEAVALWNEAKSHFDKCEANGADMANLKLCIRTKITRMEQFRFVPSVRL